MFQPPMPAAAASLSTASLESRPHRRRTSPRPPPPPPPSTPSSSSPPSRRYVRQLGQRIVKKYKRFSRELEFRRLRSVIPAVKEKESVSKVEILEAAITYIDQLHSQLVTSVHSRGGRLPAALQRQLETERQRRRRRSTANQWSPPPPPSVQNEEPAGE